MDHEQVATKNTKDKPQRSQRTTKENSVCFAFFVAKASWPLWPCASSGGVPEPAASRLHSGASFSASSPRAVEETSSAHPHSRVCRLRAASIQTLCESGHDRR